MLRSISGSRNPGEFCALAILQNYYTFLDANWKCKAGEIDLIFEDQGRIIFVEVKSRYLKNSGKYKDPFLNITRAKQEKLRTLAQIYLLKKYGRKNWPDFRIDIVGITFKADTFEILEYKHLQGAL